MRFTKMEGTGNDYIYLNCLEHTPENLPELARRFSDRHFGIGGDGLICVGPSRTADFSMRIFNADGSEGEMCGNGIRCVGKLVYETGLTRKTRLEIETLSGVKRLALSVEKDQVDSVTVDMGNPVWEDPIPVFACGETYTGRPVSMGNPHLVIYQPDVAQLPLEKLGPEMETCPHFPHRTNTEFVRVCSRDRLEVRVWERGSGETLACGTGACAAAVAAMVDGLVRPTVTVELPGGALSVCWDRENGGLSLTGPAVAVFTGEVDL